MLVLVVNGMFGRALSVAKRQITQDCFSEYSCSVPTALVPLMTVDCSSCGKQFPSGLRGYLRSHINKSGPFHDPDSNALELSILALLNVVKNSLWSSQVLG